MTKTHHFESTGEAYDLCQCDGTIAIGDVIVIESEQVVGVADTWPVAVTTAHGDLHTFSPDANITRWAAEFNEDRPAVTAAKLAGYDAAIAEARLRGWAVNT